MRKSYCTLIRLEKFAEAAVRNSPREVFARFRGGSDGRVLNYLEQIGALVPCSNPHRDPQRLRIGNPYSLSTTTRTIGTRCKHFWKRMATKISQAPRAVPRR